jgi:hypothetical protein
MSKCLENTVALSPMAEFFCDFSILLDEANSVPENVASDYTVM